MRCVPPISEKEISLKTFHRNVFKTPVQQAGHRAERSCSLRPRKAVAFLTHLLRAPKSKGAGSFAVCGQRLRGHVPSKNTSPTVLSWISLTTPTTPVLSVPARYFPLSPHKKCTPDFSDVHMISKVILRACVRRKYMRIFEQIFLQTRQKFAGILSYGKNF